MTNEWDTAAFGDMLLLARHIAELLAPHNNERTAGWQLWLHYDDLPFYAYSDTFPKQVRVFYNELKIYDEVTQITVGIHCTRITAAYRQMLFYRRLQQCLALYFSNHMVTSWTDWDKRWLANDTDLPALVRPLARGFMEAARRALICLYDDGMLLAVRLLIEYNNKLTSEESVAMYDLLHYLHCRFSPSTYRGMV